MEGIETVPIVCQQLTIGSVSRCPDMEGIETYKRKVIFSGRSVSLGASTWRGLKPPGCGRHLIATNVIRCPDMEGIETWTKCYVL